MQNSLISIPIPYRQEYISLKKRFAIFRKELFFPILVIFGVCAGGSLMMMMIMSTNDEQQLISTAFVMLVVALLVSIMYGATLSADLFDGKGIVCLLDFEDLVKINNKYVITFKVHQVFTLKIAPEFFEGFKRGDIFELYFLPISQTILSVKKIPPSQRISFTMSSIKAPSQWRYLLSVLFKTEFLALVGYLIFSTVFLLWVWLVSLEDTLYEPLLNYWQAAGWLHLGVLLGLAALLACTLSFITYAQANRSSWRTAFTCVGILAVIALIFYYLLYGNIS